MCWISFSFFFISCNLPILSLLLLLKRHYWYVCKLYIRSFAFKNNELSLTQLYEYILFFIPLFLCLALYLLFCFNISRKQLTNSYQQPWTQVQTIHCGRHWQIEVILIGKSFYTLSVSFNKTNKRNCFF